MLDVLKPIRAPNLNVAIVAGNVVTARGTHGLINECADIVKVGVSPKAMSITRIQTGVGRPQFSVVLKCATEVKKLNKAVWVDRGVHHPRNVALVLAAGASHVMIGSWFTGIFELPSVLRLDSTWRHFVEIFGMASARAVSVRISSEDSFGRARKTLFEAVISTSRMYLDPDRPGVEDLLDEIDAGLRSSCTYAGATNRKDFHERPIVGIQPTAGYAEGCPLQTSREK